MTDGPNHPNGRVRDGSGTPARLTEHRAGRYSRLCWQLFGFCNGAGKGGQANGSEWSRCGRFIRDRMGRGHGCESHFFVPLV